MGNLIIKETAKKIQEIRKQRGYSGDEVAKKAGMHRATYYRYEGGDQKTIKIEKLQKIAEALEVHLADLIVWEDEENPAPLEGDGLDDGRAEWLMEWDSATPEARAAALSVLRLSKRSDG